MTNMMPDSLSGMMVAVLVRTSTTAGVEGEEVVVHDKTDFETTTAGT